MSGDKFNALFYPGTQTLINHFGEKDPTKLATLEREHTNAAAVDAKILNPVQGDFNLEHMQAIHHRIFSGVYPWAGQLRDYPLFKKRPDGLVTEFARPEEFSRINEALSAIMKDTDKFTNLAPGRYLEQIAQVYQLANEMHPFREGNGRTHRIYLDYLAERAGYRLQFSKVSPEAWNYAASMSARINLGDGERVDGRTRELEKVFSHVSNPVGGAGNAYLRGREGLAPEGDKKILGISDLSAASTKSYRSTRRL
jgi:cell filamentation protein